MERSLRLGLGLVSTLAAAIALGSVASATRAPTKWTTLHAARSSVTVQLPASWRVHVPNGNDVRLLVADPNGTAWLGVVVGPNAESWRAFYTRMYKLRRTEELARDPHASIRTRVTTLPAGRAFESIVVRTDQSTHRLLREEQLDFLRDGMQYEFEYFCLERFSSTCVPLFHTSARSIRLT
jgi:hypothetical protein